MSADDYDDMPALEDEDEGAPTMWFDFCFFLCMFHHFFICRMSTDDDDDMPALEDESDVVSHIDGDNTTINITVDGAVFADDNDNRIFPVGHTNEDIDQVFSRICAAFRHNHNDNDNDGGDDNDPGSSAPAGRCYMQACFG